MKLKATIEIEVNEEYWNEEIADEQPTAEGVMALIGGYYEGYIGIRVLEETQIQNL